MNFKSSFKVNATVISNAFIDEYMAGANGEYVKEYLYLMRHEGEEVTVSMIADALNHTEADVARALAYWKKTGVLGEEVPVKQEESPAASETACARKAARQKGKSRRRLPNGRSTRRIRLTVLPGMRIFPNSFILPRNI